MLGINTTISQLLGVVGKRVFTCCEDVGACFLPVQTISIKLTRSSPQQTNQSCKALNCSLDAQGEQASRLIMAILLKAEVGCYIVG